MKKVGIDARLYYQTGVGTYLRNLLYYLQKKDHSHFDIQVVVMANELESIKKEVTEFKVMPVSARWHTFQEQTTFLKDLNILNLDLMHFTYFGYPYFYGKPFLSTIHDLTPLNFKTGQASTKSPLLYEAKYQAFRLLLQNQVEKSVKIITPTNTIKNQIVETFGEQYKSKIVPIYEGMDESLLHAPSYNNEPYFHRMKGYFIYVGNFYPHKNVETLVNAFAAVKEDYGLLLVGPNDFFAERIADLIDKKNLRLRIKMIHNSGKSELKALYQNALALVHPSLAEGFGLPLVEAIHFNLPVIASDIPVFHELLGKSFTAFDPHSSEDITAKINAFILNKKIPDYSQLRKKYSFEAMATEHMKLYTELLQS